MNVPDKPTISVVAAQRGVVVELLEAHPEALPDGDHDVGQQGGAIGVEEPVEGSADAIVAEVLEFTLFEPEEPAGKPLHHLRLAVDGLPLDDDRAEQNAQRLGVSRQLRAGDPIPLRRSRPLSHPLQVLKRL